MTKTKKILIVDDDLWVLKIFHQMLELEGYEVLDATNGQEAIDLYRQQPTDLVITDMVMPVKDGLKTIMELVNEFPDVKIIAISGGGAIEPERYLSLAENIGSIKTIQKPVTNKELIASVQEIIGTP